MILLKQKKSLNLAILSAKLAPDTSSFNALWKDIAEAQHKAGITEMPKPIPQLALDKIASDQQKATRDEEWKKVSKWLKRLDDNGKDYTYQVGQLNTDPFLDIVGYLKSIPTSDSQKYFYELHTIADKLVAAHYMIEKKIKEIH